MNDYRLERRFHSLALMVIMGFNAPVTQRLESPRPKRVVEGSNPSGRIFLTRALKARFCLAEYLVKNGTNNAPTW